MDNHQINGGVPMSEKINQDRRRSLDAKAITIAAAIAAVLAVLGGVAISAQDKYTLKVPGGLAFSEFRGYEAWETISVSHNGQALAVIFGNRAMIDAFKAGIPGNGKPFPDGAKMAKIHWKQKTAEAFPGQPFVP